MQCCPTLRLGLFHLGLHLHLRLCYDYAGFFFHPFPTPKGMESEIGENESNHRTNEPGRVEERTRPSAPTGCRKTSPSLRIAATGRSSRIDRIDPSTTTTNITAYRGRLRVRVRWAPGLNPALSDGAPSTRRTRARTTEPRRKPARNEQSISAARRYPEGTSKGATSILTFI